MDSMEQRWCVHMVDSLHETWRTGPIVVFYQLKQGVEEVINSIWAMLGENLSSGFLTERVSNQFPQLQRLARKLKFHLKQVYILYFPKSE